MGFAADSSFMQILWPDAIACVVMGYGEQGNLKINYFKKNGQIDTVCAIVIMEVLDNQARETI